MHASRACAPNLARSWLLCGLLAACEGASPGHTPPPMAASSAAVPATPAGVADGGRGGSSPGGTPVTGAGQVAVTPAVASDAAQAGQSAAMSAGGSAPSAADGGSPGAAGAGAAGEPATGVTSTMVDASGCSERFTTAVHLALEMNWPDTQGTVAGSGPLHVWAKMTYTAAGDGWTSESRACGVLMPPLTTQAVLDGLKLGYEFPVASFDDPAMPTFVGGSTRGNGTWLINPGALVLGTVLGSADEPWPARQSLILVDHDGDGKPGITVMTTQGDGFVSPPTDITFSTVADQMYVAARIKLRITAPDLACVGTVHASAESMGFDFTPVGCHVKDAGECPASTANLYNRFLPKLTLGMTGKAILVPIAEQADCADVRAALPNTE